jgi:hypothetical protein
MNFSTHTKDKKAFIFGLDNVIYPEKDYLLQVYYLYAEFLSYMGQMDSKAILSFMQLEFSKNGSVDIFDKTALQFNIESKYKENFQLLHLNARLPLKLLLYKQVLAFLQELIVESKEIFLLVEGNPAMQLNKIKQMEWHGLEKYLKVYFTQEFDLKPSEKVINFICETHSLCKEDLLFIGFTKAEEDYAKHVGLEFININFL